MLAELQYDLTRRQRLIPHIKIWGLAQISLIIGLVGATAIAIDGSWKIALFLGLPILWFGRGYIIGLMSVLFVKLKHMDIRIEDNGLGYMLGTERWYIHFDGLTSIRDLEPSVWTIQHCNGTVVNIPKKDLSEEVLAFLRDWRRRANDNGDQPDERGTDPKNTKA